MFSCFDIGQHQPVGVGMALNVIDISGKDLVPPGSKDIDFFDFQASQCQATGQLGYIDLYVHEFIEPFEWNSHAVTLLVPKVFAANCCRNRRSFPAKARTSSTPWRIMTKRSIPSPKAKPEYLSAS